jgi:hypothetical protein
MFSSWGVYYLNETAKSVGKRTLSKDQIHVSNKLVEFTNVKQGGVYVMAINGNNNSHVRTLKISHIYSLKKFSH